MDQLDKDCTPLYLAAQKNDLNEIKKLLDSKADINGTNLTCSVTALDIAGFCHHVETIELLLERKANPCSHGIMLQENQFNFLSQYFLQKGVVAFYNQKNITLGVSMFQAASNRGLSDGQTSLGYCYFAGLGIKQDVREGFRLYRLANFQNNKCASYNLAQIYKHGDYVKQDFKISLDYYTIVTDEQTTNVSGIERNRSQTYPTLFDYIKFLSSLPWQYVLAMAVQIAHSLYDLFHKRSLVHGNVCENTIAGYDINWTIEEEKINYLDSEWEAPELFSVKNEKSLATDIFSFGFVLYILYYGKIPWMDESKFTISKKLFLGERPEWTNPLPPLSYQELVNQCWDEEPLKRPKIHFIINELKKMQHKPPKIENYIVLKWFGSDLCFVQEEKKDNENDKFILKFCSSEFISRVENLHSEFLIQSQKIFHYSQETWCIVYSYYPEGNLKNQLKVIQQKKKYLLAKEIETQIINWMLQICEGLFFLHNQSVYHGNVNLSNLFLDEGKKIHLGYIHSNDGAVVDFYSDIQEMGIVFAQLLNLSSNEVKGKILKNLGLKISFPFLSLLGKCFLNEVEKKHISTCDALMEIKKDLFSLKTFHFSPEKNELNTFACDCKKYYSTNYFLKWHRRFEHGKKVIGVEA